jgi:hypothetical protein
VCCGTKRLAEIACPPTCGYLAAARQHPAAVVARQQERDVATLLPTIRNLTERQYQLFFLFQGVIARHVPDAFAHLLDEDVAEAAAVVAAALETSARGVIYEPPASSPTAERLARDLKTMLAEIRQQGANVSEREAAIVLRSVERGARETRNSGDGTGADTAYLELMARLLQLTAQGNGPASVEASPASPIILP